MRALEQVPKSSTWDVLPPYALRLPQSETQSDRRSVGDVLSKDLASFHLVWQQSFHVEGHPELLSTSYGEPFPKRTATRSTHIHELKTDLERLLVRFLISQLIPAHPSELRDALTDLNEAREEAREEGFSPPSHLAIENATRLLQEMYSILPRRFEVYPMPDGEIAIDAPGGYGRSVILLCYSDGGALCSVNIDGNHRRARYSNADALPDGFLREALDELVRSEDQAA